MMEPKPIDIPVDGVCLRGELQIPNQPKGIIIFSHGSGSSHLSPRNRAVADKLFKRGFSTLLFDLLTPQEDTRYERRLDIELLTRRLIDVTDWQKNQPGMSRWPVGYFGASTGAAAALCAAATLGQDMIKAVVSRGGRPDLAYDDLEFVNSPTLLLVGSLDQEVITLNKKALARLKSVCKIKIIPGASHLFEEPGTLDEVIRQSGDWFVRYLYHQQIAVDKDYMG